MIRAVARATVAAAALSIALGAVASAGSASPIPGTLGLALTPAPIHVDEVRALSVVNRSGGLELTVTLTPSAGYAVEPATFALPVDGVQVVTVTAVNPEADGTLAAVATADVAGNVQSAIRLDTRFVHATWFERNPAAIPAGLLLALAGGLVMLALVRRRYRS